jgi:hypothetical protein
MTPAELDHVLEEVADAVMHCPAPAVQELRLAGRLELANLVRRDVKRRLLDSRTTPFPIEEKTA